MTLGYQTFRTLANLAGIRLRARLGLYGTREQSKTRLGEDVRSFAGGLHGDDTKRKVLALMAGSRRDADDADDDRSRRRARRAWTPCGSEPPWQSRAWAIVWGTRSAQRSDARASERRLPGWSRHAGRRSTRRLLT